MNTPIRRARAVHASWAEVLLHRSTTANSPARHGRIYDALSRLWYHTVGEESVATSKNR